MRRFLALLTVLILSGVLAFAQDRVVTGTVTDEQGKPVPFATVTVKGSAKGVSADANGVFSIKAKQGDVLVFSSTDRVTKEVTVGTSSFVNASLASTGKTITEVIISGGYGTRRTQRSAVSNAQVVNNTQLTTVRPTSLNDALAGKVAGIQVRSQSGVSLGKAATIRLHGEGGFGSGVLLYVVDGNPVPNQLDGSGNVIPGSSTLDINPDDIEDLTVLNGPTGAAIYGPQAAAGAVIITTKRAKRGQKGIGVDINTGLQFNKVTNLPRYQNIYGGGQSGDFYQFHYKAGMPTEWQALDGKYYPDYTDDSSWGPRLAGQEYIPWYAWYPGTNLTGKTASWVPQPDNGKEFFNTGIVANNNVSFSKAGDGYTGRISYTNLDIKGMVPNEYQRKNMLNSNFSVDLGSHFTAGMNFNFSTETLNAENNDAYSNQSTGSFNSWFHRDLDMSILKTMADYTIPQGFGNASGMLASWNLHNNPNSYDASNPAGFFAGNYWYNHFSYFNGISNVSRRDRLTGDLNLTYKITNDLKFRFAYRKSEINTNEEDKVSSLLEKSALQSGVKAYYGTDESFLKDDRFEFTGTYTKKVKDFNFDLLGGGELVRIKTKDVNANTNEGFNLPDGYFLSNSKNPISYGNYRSEEKRRAIFGRLNIGFRNYLFADITLRNDWYSALVPPDYAINTNYTDNVFVKSFGLSFVFSDLIKKNTPWLSYGKIRGSWGETPQGIAPYGNALIYGIGSDQWNGNFVMSVPNTVPRGDLVGAIETVREGGIDLRFLKNRIGISATYFNGVTTNAPVRVQINGASGFTTAYLNTGKQTRNYADFQLNLKPVNWRSFAWDITLNMSKNIKNVIDSIAPGITQMNYSNVNNLSGLTGQGAIFSGITTPRVVHVAHQQWGMLVGGGKTYMNGKPVVDAQGHFVSRADLGLDDVQFGSVLPDFTGGLQNTFTYKNFTLNVNIDFQQGGKFFSLSSMWGAYSGLTARTAVLNDKGIPVRDPVNDGGGVHVQGVLSDGKTPVDVYVEAQDYFHSLTNNNIYDDYVYDLTFVKLREVSIGYNIPVKKLKFANKWLQNANFSIVSKNPLLIYAKTNDFDPSEITNIYGENGQFPGTRSIGFNLKLGF
jgi:TonB-linked SusC/RagA family outer membrane protein